MTKGSPYWRGSTDLDGEVAEIRIEPSGVWVEWYDHGRHVESEGPFTLPGALACVGQHFEAGSPPGGWPT